MGAFDLPWRMKVMSGGQRYAVGVEQTAYEWTDRAFELMTEGKLIISLGRNGLITARGVCPRCEHDPQYSHLESIVLPQGPVGTLGRGGHSVERSNRENLGRDPYVTVPIQCACSEEHEGRPVGEAGCGITFNTEVLAP